ncbi:MAG: HypC/HybG/HupF family hydrogenase formation chaperone [Candidatus Thermoplasmatota archaeon]|nr:HypC/HybG/HupF family hydrogenase formation chaperone [Candidatus Thermoplasmatota archaeon]
MCLAIPGKIVKILNDHAIVDYGEGTAREVNISLVRVKKGDYVLVHAGFAIEIIDKKEAKETLDLFKKILSEEGE